MNLCGGRELVCIILSGMIISGKIVSGKIVSGKIVSGKIISGKITLIIIIINYSINYTCTDSISG